MKKIVLRILAIVIIVTGIVIVDNSVFKNRNKSSHDIDKLTIKIGAILPLSGNAAHGGERVKKALIYAVKQFNKNPDNVFNYKLVIEDNQMQPVKSVIAMHKLVNYDKISAVLSVFTGDAQVIKPIVEKEKIIHFNTARSSEIFDRKYTFGNNIATNEIVSATMAFIEKNKIKNIALLFENSAYGIGGQELLDILKPMMREQDIQFTEYRFNAGERNFSILITKLKNAKHDLVLLFGLMPGIALAYIEMKRQNVSIPILGYDTFELANYNKNLFDGYFELGIANNSAWAKDVGLDFSDIASYLYDSLNIIMQTYERTGKVLGRIPTADEFKETLYEIRTYDGASGHFILEDSGHFRSKAYLKKVVNGQLEVIDE